MKNIKKIMLFALALVVMGTTITGCGGERPSSDRISVVSREDGSGTRGAFIELVGIEEKGDNGAKKDLTTKEAIIANKTDVMLTNIASDPNSIGYVSLGSLGDGIKAISIDGIACTSDAIKAGEYKISRPFNIATKENLSEVAEDFIAFILSSEGQEIIKNGYIPVDETAKTFAGNNPKGKITVAGSSSVTPIMEKLKEAYLEINKDAEIEIQMSDSTAGVTGAIEGTCEIGMASRGLKDTELAELTETTIAMDGIAIIIHPTNSVEDLSIAQIADIFTGKVTTWESMNDK